MKRVGLGLDFQHLDSYKLPFNELLKVCGCTLSHVSIVSLTSVEEARSFKSMADGLPIIHHLSGVAPAGLGGVNIKQLAEQARLTHVLDAKWCLEDIGIWDIGPYSIPYFAPPVLCKEVLEQTIRGVLELQDKLGVEFLAEVPSCSFICGDVSLDDFFSTLVERTGCGVVLDLSHVYSYALYTNQSAADLLASFPLEPVREFHVAGGSIHPMHAWRYRDTHCEPILLEVESLLFDALLRCSRLVAITYEVGAGMSLELLASEVVRLNSVCERAGFLPKFN